jgi:hypothetical protein
MRWGPSAQQHSVPLGLTSFDLGSRRPLLGLSKLSSVAFEIEMGEYEARKTCAMSRNVNEVSIHGAGSGAVPTAVG